MRTWQKEIAKNIVFVLLITAMFFLVVEVGSRVAYSVYSGSPAYLTYGFHSIFVKSLREDQPEDKRPIFRIACFGGSTTKGCTIKNYSYYLERYLQKNYTQKRIIVESFGINGATPVEASYILRSSIDMDIKPRIWGLEEDKIDRLCTGERSNKIPDLVFLYSHLNATWTENLRLRRLLSEDEYKKLRYLSPGVSLKGKHFIVRLAFGLNYYLKSKSFFYYGLCRLFFWLQHDRYIIPHEKVSEGLDVVQKSVQQIQKKISSYQKYVKTSHFRESLNMAIYTAQRLRVPIILGTIPVAIEKYSDDLSESAAVIHEIYANVIEETCHQNNVPVFNGVKLFRETSNANEFFVTDLVHLTEEGDRFLGEKLGAFIIKQGYIK
jgi:hypothetical protein